MKIDNKTILNIIGVVALYMIFRKGSDCHRMYGPQGMEWRGECYECPQSVLTSGVVAPSEQDMECVRMGLSKGNCTLC